MERWTVEKTKSMPGRIARWLVTGTLLVFASVVVLVALDDGQAGAQSTGTTGTTGVGCAVDTFQVLLSGSNEVPPVSPAASGTVTLYLNSTAGTIDGDWTVTGLTSSITGAHIHNAVAGANGAIVVTFSGLPPGGGSFPTSNTGVDPTLIDAIKLNPTAYYVNVHTATNVGGETRGQLTLAACPTATSTGTATVATDTPTASVTSTATVATSTPTPSVTTTATVATETPTPSVTSTATVSTATSTASVTSTATVATETPTSSVTSTATVATSTPTPSVTGTATVATTTPTPSVTTTGVVGTTGAGATCPSDAYRALLSGANEVGPVSPAGGGSVTLYFDSAGGQIMAEWTITGLTSSITGAHIHSGVAGTNGSIVVTFTGMPTSGGSFTTTTTGIPSATIDAIIANPGAFYVNVHTTTNLGGETRGQVTLVGCPTATGTTTVTTTATVATSTPTPSVTGTATVATETPTSSVTSTATVATSTPTASVTSTATVATETPTSSVTSTATVATSTPTPSVTGTATVATETPTSSVTSTATVSTATPTASVTSTATVATETPTSSVTATATVATSTPTPSVTGTATIATETPTSSVTTTATVATSTPTPSVTGTATVAAETPTSSPTFSPTATPTATRTGTATPTLTISPISSETSTSTPTSTRTSTPTASVTVTAAASASPSSTATPTATPTSTPTTTATANATLTAIVNQTQTAVAGLPGQTQTAIASLTAAAGAQQTATAAAFQTQSAAIQQTGTAIAGTATAFAAQATQTAAANAAGATATRVAFDLTLTAIALTAQANATATANAFATERAQIVAIAQTAQAQLALTATAQAGATGTALAGQPAATQTAAAQRTLTAAAQQTQIAATLEPRPRSVLPSFGPTTGGTLVEIAGSGFQAGATVAFGGLSGTVLAVDPAGSSLVASVPASTIGGAVDVRVTNPNTRSGVLQRGFTYVPVPTVSTMAPAIGPTEGSTLVTLTGTNLGDATTVLFDNLPSAIVGNTATRITVIAPPHAVGSVSVVVVTSGGFVAAPTPFAYVDQAAATAAANATQTAVAFATTIAQANATATTQALFQAATATAQAPGRSAAFALPIALGVPESLTVAAISEELWYRFSATAGTTYEIRTDGAQTVNTLLFLYRLVGDRAVVILANGGDPTRPGSGFSRILYTSPTTQVLYVRARALTANVPFTLTVTEVQGTPIPTATATVTATPTRTPTLTPTPIPNAPRDQYEPDPLPTQGPLVTVNGAAINRSFHTADDIDHIRFIADTAGLYTIRTSALGGGASTSLTLLRQDGAFVLDQQTGQSIENDDDSAPGAELGASRIEYAVSGADVGRTFAVRIRRKSIFYGAGVVYSIGVERSAYTPTPTATLTVTGTVAPSPTFTPTVTPPPTRAAGNADAWESDDDRTLAGVYNLRDPITHIGRQPTPASGPRNDGPGHNFHAAGDADWLRLDLPPLDAGATLEIRTSDLGRIPGSILQTDTLIYLYRVNAGGNLALVRLNDRCPGQRADERGSCVDWEFGPGDALQYSGQSLYLRVRNFARNLYGNEVTYNLTARVIPPGIVRSPTPTVSSTSVASTALGVAPFVGPATPTPTVSRTATTVPEPIDESVNAARGGQFRTSNIDIVVDVPPGSRNTGVGMRLSISGSRISGTSVGSGADRSSIQFISARALDEETGEPISEFDRSIGFCAEFTLNDVAGLDQSTLQPYFVDPLTGARSTEGITRTRLIPATETQSGTICFRATHFTDFDLAAVPGNTATPTITATAVPSATVTVTGTATAVPTVAASTTPTATATSATTPTATATSATTPTATATRAPQQVATMTPTPSATATTGVQPPTATPTFAAISTVLPVGGTTVDANNGTLRLSIPAGVVQAGGQAVPVQLNVSQQTAPRSAAAVNRGIRAVQIDMQTLTGQPITQLSRPITIEMTYTDAELRAAGLTDISLQILFTRDGVNWQLLPSSVDRVNRRVSATVDHLTTFALAGPPVRFYFMGAFAAGSW